MDLELSDEQVWLQESVNTLLERHWPAAEAAWQADEGQGARLWDSFVEFGVLGGELGAIELCLVARAIGSHLASVPFLGSVAARYALAPFAAQLPDDVRALLDGNCAGVDRAAGAGRRLVAVGHVGVSAGRSPDRHQGRRRVRR